MLRGRRRRLFGLGAVGLRFDGCGTMCGGITLLPVVARLCRCGVTDVSLQVELRDPPITSVYQRIAPEATRMQAQGTWMFVMFRQLGVDPPTVEKAVAWFRERGNGS